MHFLDYDELERNRGITIYAKQAALHWKQLHMNFVDTPGHVDFSAEMERTLAILDYAILIISGSDGVQAHTETIWQLLKAHQIPTFVFVNKMDISYHSKEELLKEKESFFESLGHDLITPLSLILAPANDMLRETKEDDIQYERLSIITKNAAFLSDLFSTILDFKRVEFSEVKINNRNIEIVSFCRIIVNAFNYLASSEKNPAILSGQHPLHTYMDLTVLKI